MEEMEKLCEKDGMTGAKESNIKVPKKMWDNSEKALRRKNKSAGGRKGSTKKRR